jgi:hypothetical protein
MATPIAHVKFVVCLKPRKFSKLLKNKPKKIGCSVTATV